MVTRKLMKTIYVKPDVIDKVKKLAGKVGLNESQMYCNLIDVGLDSAVFLDGVGLLGAIASGAEAVRQIKEKFQDGALDRAKTV